MIIIIKAPPSNRAQLHPIVQGGARAPNDIIEVNNYIAPFLLSMYTFFYLVHNTGVYVLFINICMMIF